MHQNIQLIRIKVCRPQKFAQHMGGLSPTICGLFLSEQVKAVIIYDGRSGLSVVAFRTAPPMSFMSYVIAIERGIGNKHTFPIILLRMPVETSDMSFKWLRSIADAQQLSTTPTYSRQVHVTA